MNRIEASSVEEAVKIAKELKNSGRTYWFRGQAKEWTLQSSLNRLHQIDRDLVMKKLERYVNWVKCTPGLEYLAENEDAVFAIAQHYGIPTTFIDFTTKPEVAAYFASEQSYSATHGEKACILYLDVEEFIEFWKLIKWSNVRPECLPISVPDLWRLDAQHGCFLYCPYDNLERIYDMDRIVFPCNQVITDVRPEDIYPNRKSHLEVLLDQYFMNERLLSSNKRLLTDKRIKPYVIKRSVEGYDPDVFSKDLCEHSSWVDDEIQPWLELGVEPFKDVQTKIVFQVTLPGTRNLSCLAEEVSKQFLKHLRGVTEVRKKLVTWNIEFNNTYNVPQDFGSLLGPKLARLWDGLRRLPHSDEDIAFGLGTCTAFAVALRGDFKSSDSRHWEQAACLCLSNPVQVEFGSVDGSYSRGFASRVGLTAAIRQDYISYVVDEWKEKLSDNVVGVLQKSWIPKQTFDYSSLALIFVRELAPYQVLARHTAVFYSPARLSVLGLP